MKSDFGGKKIQKEEKRKKKIANALYPIEDDYHLRAMWNFHEYTVEITTLYSSRTGRKVVI